MDQPIILLTVKQVAARLGVSRTTIYDSVSAGQLPRPVYPTPRRRAGAAMRSMSTSGS